MNIVILDGYTANPGDLSWKPLEQLGSLTVYERTAPADTVARARDAEIVLTNKVIIGKEEMDKLPQLKYIGVLATGYNVVDMEEAKATSPCVATSATATRGSLSWLARPWESWDWETSVSV